MEASHSLLENELDIEEYQELPVPLPKINSPKYRICAELAAELLANGNTVEGTAGLIGLHRQNLHTWMNTLHFQTLIETKKTARREELLSRVDGHGKKNWFATAWLLERNKAFKGEFAQPKAQAQAAGNIQINVVVGIVPGGTGTQVTIGEAPNATPCATPSDVIEDK